MGFQIQPLPAIRKSSAQNSYNAVSNTYEGLGMAESTTILKPRTPTIILLSVENSTIVIDVTNNNLNSSYIYGYEIFVNGVLYGTYAPDLYGRINITGLANNYLYKIKIKAIAGYWASINAGGQLSAYRKSDFSNEVQGTPTITLAPKSAPSMNTNQVDIKYVSSHVYQNCFPTGISLYSELYEGQTYQTRPIYFQPNMLVGTFTAEAVLRARIHFGGLDLMHGGGVNYLFSDIRVNVDTNPFTDLECFDLEDNETYSDGDTLEEMYNRKIYELDWDTEVTFAGYEQASTDHFNIDIASQLKREFVLARPYIGEKISKYIKSNVGELLKSTNSMRAFANVISLNTPGIRTYYKDFIIPYEGLIYIKPHIIASTYREGDNETTTFSYKMIDSNGDTKFIKENVSSSIILAPPQTADSFTFSALKGIADISDIYGPSASEFTTPVNFNTV